MRKYSSILTSETAIAAESTVSAVGSSPGLEQALVSLQINSNSDTYTCL